jgi:hypothetical protein
MDDAMDAVHVAYNFAGAVGGAVVDEKDVRTKMFDALNDIADIFQLVVYRHGQQCSQGRLLMWSVNRRRANIKRSTHENGKRPPLCRGIPFPPDNFRIY